MIHTLMELANSEKLKRNKKKYCPKKKSKKQAKLQNSLTQVNQTPSAQNHLNPISKRISLPKPMKTKKISPIPINKSRKKVPKSKKQPKTNNQWSTTSMSNTSPQPIKTSNLNSKFSTHNSTSKTSNSKTNTKLNYKTSMKNSEKESTNCNNPNLITSAGNISSDKSKKQAKISQPKDKKESNSKEKSQNSVRIHGIEWNSLMTKRSKSKKGKSENKPAS